MSGAPEKTGMLRLRASSSTCVSHSTGARVRESAIDHAQAQASGACLQHILIFAPRLTHSPRQIARLRNTCHNETHPCVPATQPGIQGCEFDFANTILTDSVFSQTRQPAVKLVLLGLGLDAPKRLRGSSRHQKSQTHMERAHSQGPRTHAHPGVIIAL